MSDGTHDAGLAGRVEPIDVTSQWEPTFRGEPGRILTVWRINKELRGVWVDADGRPGQIVRHADGRVAPSTEHPFDLIPRGRWLAPSELREGDKFTKVQSVRTGVREMVGTVEMRLCRIMGFGVLPMHALDEDGRYYVTERKPEVGA